MEQYRNQEGRIETFVAFDLGGLLSRVAGERSPARKALAASGFPDVVYDELKPMLGYLEFVLKQ